MSTYLTPGVYVEEVPSASKPIGGVGTSIAAFVGLTPHGPIHTPVRISNWGQFVTIFSAPDNPKNGPFMPGAYLAHSVYGFFANGGGVCWIVRVGATDGASEPRAALPAAGSSETSFTAVAREEAGSDVTIELTESKPATPEGAKDDDRGKAGGAEPTYRLVVETKQDHEEFEGPLGKGRTSLATKVNASSKLIRLDLADGAPAPIPGTYTLSAPTIEPDKLDAPHLVGDVARRQGMGALAAIDEITMVCMPDLVSLAANGDTTKFRDVQGKILAHCEARQDRMAILDPPPNRSPQEIFEWRQNEAGYDSKFGTEYWPYLEVMDPLTGRPLMIPPSGHVAGVWARTDRTRGVHKAPANEVVMATNGLAFHITQEEQGELNKAGINCIRAFPGRGIRIWGARTLSSDPEWRYLNVRRLFNYIAESINEGTQWSVFEPNDRKLWLQLRIAAENFLTRTWRDGALFGLTPAEAFYVKCDEETNPPDEIEAGKVIVEIGITPVKAAEFVVFRISQFTAGAAEVTAWARNRERRT